MDVIENKVIRAVIGTGIPKTEDNQNTDDMVYGANLSVISFRGLGEELFANERRGKPEHPLNDPKYKGGSILLAGDNYGCGSSREHAPQAHLDFGIKAIVAVGYAGIFQGNCAATGLVAVTAKRESIDRLAERVRSYPITKLCVNLETCEVIYTRESGAIETVGIQIPGATRQAFLNGTWDAMAVLRSNPAEVRAVRGRIPYFRFQ